MNILYAASEAAPFIATGGLADVAGSLPKALCSQQHCCRVVIPLYSAIKPELRAKMKFLCNFYVPLGWRNQYCGVFEATQNGVKYYLMSTISNGMGASMGFMMMRSGLRSSQKPSVR